MKVLSRALAVVSALALALASPAYAGGSITAPVNDLAGKPVTINSVTTNLDVLLGRIPRPLTRMQFLGDSRAAVGANYSLTGTYKGYAYSVQSPAVWLAAMSGQQLQLDPTIAPPACGGVSATVIKLVPVPDASGNLQTGSNYSASPTIGVTGTSGTVFAPNVVNGHLMGASVTTCGTAPSGSITSASVTITDPTGSGAVMTPVQGGFGQFGVGGTTLPECRVRLEDVVNQTYGPKPDVLLNMCGHNDLLALLSGTPVSVKTMLGHAYAMIKRESDAGILPVWIAETPTAQGGLTAGTAAQKAGYQNALALYNEGLHKMAEGDLTLNPTRTPFVLVDANRYWQDAVNNGAALWHTVDQVHPSQWGAMDIGARAEVALRPYYQTGSGKAYSTDTYDATYNPLGNVLAQWTTTSGTVSSPATGNAPAGWTLYRLVGSATSPTIQGAVGTNPVTAPDAVGLTIPSWVWTLNFPNNGANNEQVLGQMTIPAATVATEFAVGDTVKFSCEVSWANAHNINRIALSLTTGDILAGYSNSVASYFPPSNAPLTGTIPVPGSPQPFILEAPPVTLTAASISANMSPSIAVGLDASASPASAGATGFGAAVGAGINITWRNCRLRKINTALIQ